MGSERSNRERAQARNNVIEAPRAHPRLRSQQVEGFFDHFQEPIGCSRVLPRNVRRVRIDVLSSLLSADDLYRRFLAIDRRNACRRLSQ